MYENETGEKLKRPSISDDAVNLLIGAALEGLSKAFLKKEGDTRYGAAAMTLNGKIYNAGQYSSFNNITNIHAEMASVLLATMNNDPIVTALALVSSNSSDAYARICGICREFLNEHSQRTGYDIRIILSSLDRTNIRTFYIDELLPEKWIANKGVKIK